MLNKILTETNVTLSKPMDHLIYGIFTFFFFFFFETNNRIPKAIYLLLV